MTVDRGALEAELAALLAARAFDEATDRAVRGWGPEIYGWLVGVLHDEVEATDAFSTFADQLWRSLGRYDGRCSTRTWCYMLARHAAARVRGGRDPGERVPLSQAPASAIAAEVRATTALHLRTSSKNELSTLRAQLDPDDQILLVLRVDRELGWREIAHVLLGEEADAAACDRHAAALRKRFERVKAQLRKYLTQG